jgi:hypothetical protein
MVMILLEKLQIKNIWIPISIGFKNDVENIKFNWVRYQKIHPNEFPNEKKCTSRSKVLRAGITDLNIMARQWS